MENNQLDRLADLLFERLDEKQRIRSKRNRNDTGSGSAVAGGILRSYREKQGLSLRTLHDLTGLHHAFLGRIERGQRGVGIETFAKLDMIFGPAFTSSFLEAIRHADYRPGHGPGPQIASSQPTTEGGALGPHGSQAGHADTPGLQPNPDTTIGMGAIQGSALPGYIEPYVFE